MEKNTVFEGGMGELGLGIKGVLRRAARSLIEQAIETEVAVLLEEFSAVRMVNGRQAVVRNGHLPEREIMTALGPVLVKVPKVRDRAGSGIKFNSALMPPYVRKSRTVAATVPWPYLHRVSSGHMQGALFILLGEEARGLSPAALGRLKAQWAEEHAQLGDVPRPAGRLPGYGAPTEYQSPARRRGCGIPGVGVPSENG